jgi:transcription elongation GreA/GreB family factor
MSRAFVKETAESAPPPERMVDDGPNLVTPEGLAQIDAHIARLEAAMKSETNVLLRETLSRDLRYWEIRKSTAELVPPPSSSDDAEAASDLMPSPPRDSEERRARPTDIVSFGSTVTIQRKGRTQTFRIVGVDEADASKGLISFRSPLAQAILGARPGDVIEAGEPLGEIEVVG